MAKMLTLERWPTCSRRQPPGSRVTTTIRLEKVCKTDRQWIGDSSLEFFPRTLQC